VRQVVGEHYSKSEVIGETNKHSSAHITLRLIRLNETIRLLHAAASRFVLPAVTEIKEHLPHSACVFRSVAARSRLVVAALLKQLQRELAWRYSLIEPWRARLRRILLYTSAGVPLWTSRNVLPVT